MIHLGDITKISGYEVPIVDCIIGGSPCQDLSVAGKRAGLEGERSGLFMEQIRIVKEMRERDARCGVPREFIRPRYMVWENVPGAFSSNKGEDFRIVLEEIIKIVEPEANVPMPEKNKWPYSGILLGDGWSVAWRVLDAQFWGTSDKPLPQRRRRIALVADFGAHSAPEILFVRKSVSGNSEPGEPKRKEAARDVGDGADATSWAIQGSMIGRADHNGPQGDGINEDVSFTLNATDRHAVVDTYQQVTGPLMANSHPGSYTMQDAFSDMLVAGVDCRSFVENDINGTLQSSASHNLNSNNVVRVKRRVRRLTPLECERLQGYPDGWTDIGDWIDSTGKKRKASDSPRYKALGNSIALPPWKWVLKRLCACYERDATMASLFDGIGGFPLIWEQLNGKGSCLWASEIEEFPMAVTKLRFGE